VLASIPVAASQKPPQTALRQDVALVVAAVLIGGGLGVSAGLYAERTHLALLHRHLAPKPAMTLSTPPAPPAQPEPVLATVSAQETNPLEPAVHEDLPVKPAPPAQDVVVVRPHQTLAEITRRYLGGYSTASVAKLRALNPGLNPDHIEVGQQIRLPIGSGIEAGTSGVGEDQRETLRNAQ